MSDPERHVILPDTAEAHLAAMPPRLATAFRRWLAAAAEYTTAATATVIGGLLGFDAALMGYDTNAVQRTEIELRCAQAVFEWEMENTPGGPYPLAAHYDDDTLDQLLRTAQG